MQKLTSNNYVRDAGSNNTRLNFNASFIIPASAGNEITSLVYAGHPETFIRLHKDTGTLDSCFRRSDDEIGILSLPASGTSLEPADSGCPGKVKSDIEYSESVNTRPLSADNFMSD